MNPNEETAKALRATLAALGATPAQARALVETGRTAHHSVDTPETLATLKEFITATDVLGKTAHHVLGHVPDATAYSAPAEHPPTEAAATPVAAPPAPEAEALLVKLTFLREHIVSTIDVQGAEVWQRRADDGRPLQAFAEDLAASDTRLLAHLRRVTLG